MFPRRCVAQPLWALGPGYISQVNLIAHAYHLYDKQNQNLSVMPRRLRLFCKSKSNTWTQLENNVFGQSSLCLWFCYRTKDRYMLSSVSANSGLQNISSTLCRTDSKGPALKWFNILQQMVPYVIFLSASQHFHSIMEIQAFHFSVNAKKILWKKKERSLPVLTGNIFFFALISHVSIFLHSTSFCLLKWSSF